MGSIIPTKWAGWSTDDYGQVKIGKPVLSRSLVRLAGNLNHLNGIQARGFSPATAFQDGFDNILPGNQFHVGEPDKYESSRILYWVPPGVTTLHFSMMCMSYASGGNQVPHVDVSIVTTLGVDVDVGCYFDRDVGTLPGLEKKLHGDWQLMPYLVEPPDRPPTDILGVPSSPRRLSVAGQDGEIVVFKIEALRTRVLSFHILPIPGDTL